MYIYSEINIIALYRRNVNVYISHLYRGLNDVALPNTVQSYFPSEMGMYSLLLQKMSVYIFGLIRQFNLTFNSKIIGAHENDHVLFLVIVTHAQVIPYIYPDTIIVNNE